MTERNVFIGFGGTGAKIAEAVMHLAAAGLGPDNITLGLGDQDDRGGNTREAIATLEQYIRTYRQLRRQGSEHAIPDGHADVPIFATRIEPVCGGEGGDLQLNANVWVPQPRAEASTLRMAARLGEADDNDAALLDLLFAEGGEEQDLDLAQGYQGRPHVGAASILLGVDHSDFWISLKAILDEAQQRPTRIFLAGSAFGGTGASSFPTMARQIRKALGDEHAGVQLSGVLMLPYFKFPGPKEAADQTAARSEEFFAQTKRALSFYADQMDEGSFFDDLYVLGWEPLMDLGYFSKGDTSQKNPPLAPELFAALAAMREFKRPFSRRAGGGKAGRVHLAARSHGSALTWADLPPVSFEEEPRREETARSRVGQWLRFAYAWRLRYRPSFSQRRLFGAEAWYKNHLSGVDFNANPAVGPISDFVDRSLAYFAAMAAWSKQGGALRFGLWDESAFARISAEATPAGVKPVDLITHEEAVEKKFAGFDTLLITEDIEDSPRQFNACYEWLSNQKSNPRTLGAFTSALYRSVALAMGEERN